MALTQSQLDALNGVNNLTPDQSSTILGHSNGIMSKFIGGAESLLPTAGAIAGGIGGAALGGLAGIEGGPAAIATGYAGGVAGSGAGGAAGEALKEKLQGQDLNAGAITEQGVGNAAADAIGGPLLSGAGKLLSKVSSPIISAVGKGAAKVADIFGSKAPSEIAEAVGETAARSTTAPAKLATTRLSADADMMTTKELKEAASDGRIDVSGKVAPSKTEQRAGQILSGKLVANPAKNVKVVQDEIASRGKDAETYLEQNATKISNKEDLDAFNSAKASAEKYMTPAESNAYSEQTGVFQKILKSYAGDGGYTTSNYYKALKDYESQVTANLPKGKDALLVPGGSARIQAAKDVRTVVRDMVGQKNPEFKGKMFDLASLYDVQDNVLGKVAEKAKGSTTWAKRNPKKAATLAGAGAFVAGEIGNTALKNTTGIGF